jgi:hypothetical protein
MILMREAKEVIQELELPPMHTYTAHPPLPHSKTEQPKRGKEIPPSPAYTHVRQQHRLTLPRGIRCVDSIARLLRNLSFFVIRPRRATHEVQHNVDRRYRGFGGRHGHETIGLWKVAQGPAVLLGRMSHKCESFPCVVDEWWLMVCCPRVVARWGFLNSDANPFLNAVEEALR